MQLLLPCGLRMVGVLSSMMLVVPLTGDAAGLDELVIDDLPRRSFIGINGVAARNEIWPWDHAQVDALVPVLLADDRIDETERKLLNAWAQPSFEVRIVAVKESGFTPADIVLKGSFTPEARMRLRDLRPPEGRELRALWLRTGGAGWEKLTAFAARGESEREEVLGVIRDYLQEAWAESSSGNSYQPFRRVLGSLAESAGLADNPATPAAARHLLLEACEQLDKESRAVSGRAVPGFLYRWLRAPANGG